MPDPTSNPTQGEQDPSSLSTLTAAPVPGSAEPAPDETAELDAANASLAGALSVSFAVLRIVMVLLVLVFLLSGFFTVGPDEVAVRTRFGRIMPGPDGDVLTPEGGPYFRWPAPIGQVYRVPTVTVRLPIDRSFVFRAAINTDMPLADISQGERLQPEYDGLLLTSDKSIVHARYEVQYKVMPQDAATFVRHIASVADLTAATDDRMNIFREADILVRNAVEQAIVEDVAATPLSRFLQGGRSQRAEEIPAIMPEVTPDGEPTTPADPEQPAPTGEQAGEAQEQQDAGGEAAPPAGGQDQPGGDADDHEEDHEDHEGEEAPAGMVEQEDQIRVRAQQVLDELNTGITLMAVARTEQTVVSSVKPMLTAVQQAQEARSLEVGEASQYRNSALLSSAGPAWRAVLAVIDVYEEAYRLRETNPEFFEASRVALRATFSGEQLGPVLTALADALPEESTQEQRLRSMAGTYASATIEGSAGGRVKGAASRASTYMATLEAEALNFEDQLANYRDKPELIRHSLFAQTLSNIFSSEDVQTSFLAPGSDLRLRLNPRDRDEQLQQQMQSRQEREAASRQQNNGGN